MSDEILVSEINAEARVWASLTGALLKNSIRNLSSAGKGELIANLRSSVYRKDGLPAKISFSFPRHGVFFQKGVGRGYVSVNGTVMRGQKEGKVLRSSSHRANRSASVKVLSGSIERKPQDWFNGVLGSQIPVLAETLANYMADMQVNNITSFIK